jgi:hypothetical protein
LRNIPQLASSMLFGSSKHIAFLVNSKPPLKLRLI